MLQKSSPDIAPIFRPLSPDELTTEIFQHFQRRQVITQCWRKIDGQWGIYPDSYTEEWGEKEYEFVAWCLGVTLSEGGMVYGAFLDGKLKGFTSIAQKPLGSRSQYRELTSLHVSQELRGCGIGRQLFSLAKEYAKKLGGEKLYVSSNPSVESQAFYKAMGCVEAEEYDADRVKAEPFACQIECTL